jgi:hypothetical protein
MPTTITGLIATLIDDGLLTSLRHAMMILLVVASYHLNRACIPIFIGMTAIPNGIKAM